MDTGDRTLDAASATIGAAMHPLLVQLSLGGFGVPLVPVLLAVAMLGLGAIALGVLARQRAVLLLGCALSVAALGFALRPPFESVSMGVLRVSSFGALCALSLGLGWMFSHHEAQRQGLDRTLFGWVLFTALGSAVLGARVLYVVMHPPSAWPVALDFARGGLSGAGAWLGGLLGLWLASRRFGLGFLRVLDVAAPALAFAVVCVRLGCFLQGCDYGPLLGDGAPALVKRLGTLSRWPLELGLGSGPPMLLTQIARGAIDASAATSAPAHPTPLYEALVGLGLLGAVAGLSRSPRFVGQAGLGVVGGYALVGAALSPLIVDAERGALTTWLFLLLGLAASVAWALLWRRAHAARPVSA
jgi:prolipoprotein diacylglyceryltransferase